MDVTKVNVGTLQSRFFSFFFSYIVSVSLSNPFVPIFVVHTEPNFLLVEIEVAT